jgi:hypothetical protein
MDALPPFVTKYRTTAIYVAAGILLLLVAVSAFVSPSGSWPLAIVAVALVFAANLDRFSEVSAGTSGFTAKMREAQGKINDMTRMIEVMASAELYQIQSAGRWGGGRDEDHKMFLDRIVGLMNEAGIPPERIKAIKAEAWDKYVRFDYVHAILGSSYVPASDDKDMRAEWQSLRDFDNVPSPAKLADFLARHGDGDALRQALLGAYEHYWTFCEHIDEPLWRRRQNVPNIGGQMRSR